MTMPVISPSNSPAVCDHLANGEIDLRSQRLLFVGNGDEAHVGRHLLAAARQLENVAELADVREAFASGGFTQRLAWRWDRRPLHLRRFSRGVLQECERLRPTIVATTGIAPINAECLRSLRKLGARVVNYSTDDPFNRAHRASWFVDSLPHYEIVFSPRRANIDDLKRAGCGDVRYLPFGYAPDQHFRDQQVHETQSPAGRCDVLFVGGADTDRVPMLAALIDGGFDAALYGGYWDRYKSTRRAHRGFASASQVRAATAAAKLCLILVRRANRDGHVMRSFEAAACGGCLLVEDTAEHREIFTDTVTYFRTTSQMVEQARQLVGDPERRRSSAEASYRRIVIEGRNRYADRLQTIIETAARQ